MVNNQLILWPFLGGLLCLTTVVYLLLDLSRRHRGNASMIELSRIIRAGAHEFLRCALLTTAIPLLLLFLLIGLTHAFRPDARLDWSVAVAFSIGVLVTALAGVIGLATAVRANSRTAEAARLGGAGRALSVAIGGGAVMGLCAVGFSLIGLSVVLFFFTHRDLHLYAFALGVSLVAMFVRLGGGIYTKGADMGADFITRSEPGFSENDSRNAAIVADSVGDHLGNVIGSGVNLMESLIEAVIAAMAIALTLHTRVDELHSGLVMLPLLVVTIGALASLLGIVYIRAFTRGNPGQLLGIAVLGSAAVTLLVAWFLVDWLAVNFSSELRRADCTKQGIFLSLALGFAAAVPIVFFSGYFTSFLFRPTRRIAERSQFGSALTILEGLSVGMKSSGILTLIVAVVVVLAYRQAEFYGIAMAGTGMLAMVGMVVTLNALGPIVDNAGAIAEMVRMDRSVRDITENLHALGNVTTAMGKGFANAAAVMVALGLLLAYFKAAALKPSAMALDHPAILAGLLLGAMFPFYLSALLLRAVTTTASAVIGEVRRQLNEIPGLREGKTRPDFARCGELITRRAIRGMLGPGLLLLAAPVAVGLLLGKIALAGFLAGALACSLPLGFQMVNSGGAMDNAKKYIEEGYFGGKGSPAYKAAVVGDNVGDAFKDTLGPALAIAIKLMCVVALLLTSLLK